MNIITGNQTFLLFKYRLNQLVRFFSRQEKLRAFGHTGKLINKVFVINLDRQKERWRNIQKELDVIALENKKSLLDFTEKFSAIDAKKQSIKTNEICSDYKLQDQYYVDPNPQLLNIIREREINIDLTNQEVAVALSHVSIWKKIVNENISSALILEDDIYFENKFSNKLNSLWKEVTESNVDFDLLYLSYKRVDFNPDIRKFSKNLSIPKRGLWWFSGYILTNKGAKKLLNKLPVVGPVDLWINHKFSELNVFISNQSIINQKLFLGSDNNYSILPILSQIGIKSNKTFIELDKLKGINPVFIFNISSKDSVNLIKLEKLLSLNSYRTYRIRSEKESNHIVDLIARKEPLLFDAYIGFDVIMEVVPSLVQFYPNVKIILLTDSNSSISYQYDKYFNQNIFCVDCGGSITKKVSKLLKVKNWNLDSIKIPNIEFAFAHKEQVVSISNNFKYLEHDVHPWVIPIEGIKKYLPYTISENKITPIGKCIENRIDSFNKFDLDYWAILEDTFPSNQAQFCKENFKLLHHENSGFELKINDRKSREREYSSSSIHSKKEFLYGSFEIAMRAIKGKGIISAFFLHRNDPWQEIDIEFLGHDTTKILINVYYNPGVVNTNYNYGVRGTPVLVDLGFDASEDFHNYRIEWEHHEIRWYVDDKIIHVRKTWAPTPIPDLPMSIYVNAWITNSEELAGKFDDKILPKTLTVSQIKIHDFEYKKPTQD